jgi:general secretion pathway protein A
MSVPEDERKDVVKVKKEIAMTHYLHFYELAKAPFSPSADSEFLYWSPARQELRQTFVRAIAERKGLMMLTGEEGVGKTTLLQAVLERAALRPVKVVFAPLSAASSSSLLATLVRELEQDATRDDAATTPHAQLVLETYATENGESASFHYLSTLLMEEYRRGVNVVLVIDDAQAYSAGRLLWLRRLAKLRVEGKALVQILLVGGPAFDETVNRPWLWRLRRQLAVRLSMAPLSVRESQAYLHRRLAATACGETPVLWPEGITLLAQHGHGLPRLLNMLGHDALSAGLVAEQRPISTQIVRSVLPEVVQPSQAHPLFSRMLPLVKKAAGLAIVVGGMMTLSLSGASYLRSESSPTVVSAVAAKPDEISPLATEPPPTTTSAIRPQRNSTRSGHTKNPSW